jgi:DNA-directed RNA polymerase specialized sigma24 family protein
MSPPSLRRYRAERLLRKDFAGLRSKVVAIVRAQLRGKGVRLDPADLEACYAQAWHGLYAAVLDGEVIESPSAWLVLVTFRRAIDEYRSASRNRVGADADAIALVERADASGPVLAADPDFAAQLDTARSCGASSRECAQASPNESAKRLRSATCRASRGQTPPGGWGSARRACAS